VQGVDAIGWAASLVLLATLLRQVYVQWRERSTAGVSSWLFVGQCAANAGFALYSGLIGNAVFVFTNIALLVTALLGQMIYRRNRALAERAGDPSGGRGRH